MKIRGPVMACVLAAALATPALAVTTAFWRLSSLAEFDKGKFDRVAIASNGTLALSPAYERVPGLECAYLWALAQDASGNIYAGSGDKGLIYRISGKKDLSEFCKLPDQHVLSLAFDKAGNLFAGTAPRGVIHKITPAGQATVFAETKESYVWALAWSRDGSTLYAATGPRGRILKVTSAGQVQTLLDSGQNHILCLALDKGGILYGGSEPAGIVYKVTPEGKVSVVYDAAEGDVHGLVFDDQGNLYAATAAAGDVPAMPAGRAGGMFIPEMAAPPPAPMGESAPQPQQPRQRMGTMTLTPPSEPPAPSPPPPTVSAKNCIYKIAPDGRVTQMLALDRTMILCLAVVGDELWAGTGNGSRLYRVSLSDTSRYEVIMDPDELQVIALLPLAAKSPQGAIAVATGNQGRLYTMKTGFASEGRFLSPVFDTSNISQWGAVSWEGETPSGAGVAVAARTGNSSKPDATWSDWSAESKNSGRDRAQCPPARFIQFRATLTSSAPDKTPRIRKISVPYLMLNMPPVVAKLTVDGAAAGASAETTESDKPAASTTTSASGMSETLSKMVSKAASTTTTKAAAAAPGAIPAHKPQRTISWEAKDPDGDKLKYTLLYRGTEEKEWKPLKDDLSATSHAWDTETVPDGEYVIRVVASDSPSNPPDKALQAERLSEPVLVDNTKPAVESLKATPAGEERWRIRGRVADAMSIILEIQYSVDAKEWIGVYPTTGIFDSRTAEFDFSVEKLPPGEHTIAIKATDAAGNRGLGKIVFR